jgi:signal transduction histidine kinase
LANACEFARAQITFSTVTSLTGAEIVWTITDDGPGTPPEHASSLFKPLFTTRAGHAGLGLALAHKLVGLHGGQLTAHNRPEGGFQVRAVFPKQPASIPNG